MFENEIAILISSKIDVDINETKKYLIKSAKDEHGDYAFPCYQLAKVLHKSPDIIANELAGSISSNEWLEKCENVKGYVNFFINKKLFNSKVINEVLDKKDKYGSSNEGVGKKCLIEHTSINPNASPHIGRARNAIIGDFIVRLMKFEGYDVTVHYFVNDIGKQISMLVFGAQDTEKIDFKDLLDLYVSINHRISIEPELEKQIFDLLYKLENGDEFVKSQFKKIVNICITGQTKIFNEIGIKYDYFDYESQFLFDNSLNDIINKLQKTGLMLEDIDGRYYINLEKYDLSPLVITRGDKTSLYPLRDIAYTLWKSKQNADKNLIVLGQDQELYFKQIAAIVKELGYEPPEVIHYSFVLLVEGKMSTRNGTVVLLEDFMKEATNRAAEEIAKRQDEVDKIRAKKIAYSAIKYSMEKTSNDRNVIFDWEKALSFEGDTGSYLLYSYARINSILLKCEASEIIKYDYDKLINESEFDLVKCISEFPDVISKAKIEKSPHIITHYAFELAKKFSTFYLNCNIINSDDELLKGARIKLILSVKYVLENIFYILGIEPVERM